MIKLEKVWNLILKREKEIFMNKFKTGLDTVSFHIPDNYRNYFQGRAINNTFFMSYLRYRGGQEYFRDELDKKFDGDLPGYISYLKKKYED